MKKLNRKGFTLVELLAVIIILAVVVGISIPAVLTTTKNAKVKAFQAAADSAADWFDRQYQVATTGLNDTGLAKLDQNFIDACGSDGSKCFVSEDKPTGLIINKDKNSQLKPIIPAAGLKTENIESINIIIDETTGRTCVKLLAKENGDYYGAVDKNTITSSNCQ